MSRFPTSLPPEIVSRIFSYLEQENSIECMRVCRQWYSEIPLYTTELWKQIIVSSFTNDCVARCLGPHVQSVHIFRLEASSVVKALKRADCRLTEIDVYHTPSVISYNQRIHQDSELLSAIKGFSSTLTELVIVGILPDLPVSQLLCCLPNLTHLTLLFQEQLRNGLSQSLEESCVSFGNDATNLVYLHLDFTLSFEHRVLTVLRRCPNLKVLRLANGMSEEVRIPGSFYQIFLLCPRLYHFVWDVEDPLPPKEHVRALSEKASNHNNNDINKGIREFIFRGNINDTNGTADILRHARGYLEVLRLTNTETDLNHWNALAHVQFPRLKTVSLFHLDLPEDEWGSFFACRQNLVSFTYFPMHAGDLRLDSMIAGISTLEHLEYLRIAYDFPNLYQGDMWNNAYMLSRNIRLQHLELESVKLSDDALLDLCKISSLKVLSITAPPQLFTHGNRFEALITFADTLRATNSNLETLKLNHFHQLNDTVLEILGQVRSLSMLHLARCPSISDAGVLSFLHGSNSGKKKSMEVYDGCLLVSRHGLWT